MSRQGSAAPLLEAVWDDGAALYDPRSGDTHLLDPFTLAVRDAARRVGPQAALVAGILPPDEHAAERLSRIESALDQLIAARLL